MSSQATRQPDAVSAANWVRNYSFVRAAVSIAWVTLAFTIGAHEPAVSAALLVAYPAWDAVANLVDARRSGGLGANPSQAFNVAASAVTTLAVAIALAQGPHAVLAVYGVWAILSGLSQLLTGVRRWRLGAQWAMILSGGQSALAGAFFIKRATDVAIPGIADIAPYAAFGAFYFLVSAAWLTAAHIMGSIDIRARRAPR